jgi:hypothetical protein
VDGYSPLVDNYLPQTEKDINLFNALNVILFLIALQLQAS